MAVPPTNGAVNGAAPKVLKLSKSIATHQGNTSELKFAPLTAAVMMKHKKLPFSFFKDADGNTRTDVDMQLAGKFISDLTGIDEIILGQMSGNDFGEAVAMLMNIVLGAGN